MVRYVLVFLTALMVNFCSAQENSYFRIVPGFSKDSLDIIGPDSLKFDISIHYWRSGISIFSITGKIGLINKYAIWNEGEAYILFSTNEKMLNFGLPARGKLEKAISPDHPNLISYVISNYVADIGYHAKFSKKKIKSIIRKIEFRPLTFRNTNRQLFFTDGKGKYDMKDMSEQRIEVFLSKRDLRNVYVYDEEKLIWTKHYQQKSFKKSRTYHIAFGR